jgi:GNAT superfamily N-acetyltransferase
MRTAICPTYVHFHEVARHFLSLTASDRFLRFGWMISDVDIVAYVEALFHKTDTAFVVAEPAPDIAGAVHLEFTDCGVDLGLSVSAWARGKGIGTLLLEQAGLLARSRGVSTLFVRNLGFNEALKHLAHRVGMKVACAPDACSTRMELPAGNEGGILRKSFAERITVADYFLRFRWNAQPGTTVCVPKMSSPDKEPAGDHGFQLAVSV